MVQKKRSHPKARNPYLSPMKKWPCILIIAGVAWACAQVAPETENTSETRKGFTMVNGVERSELALTMRQMYDQMKPVADSLRKGLPVTVDYLERYQSIHTDHPTDPKKTDEAYQAMAASFLEVYEAFENARENRTQAFNKMIDACLGCHQQKCPGPMKTIRTLRVPV